MITGSIIGGSLLIAGSLSKREISKDLLKRPEFGNAVAALLSFSLQVFGLLAIAFAFFF